MKRLARWASVVAALGLAACGSPASVTGSVLGSAFNAADAISGQTVSSGTVDARVYLADFGSACHDVASQTFKLNGRVIQIDILATSSLTPGTVQVSTTTDPQATAVIGQLDATCQFSNTEAVTAGTVSVTKVDATGVSGTFDLTFNPDHVTGTFSAPNCVSVFGVVDAGAAVCK